MKLLEYKENGKFIKVAILFDDLTYAVTDVINGGRGKEDILKDAYILLKSAEKNDFEGNPEDYEILDLTEPVPNSMNIDFYELNGKVYDQYGDEIFKDITFEVVGTDKARIENGKLIEEEVTEETSFFIVAKCDTLEEKQERKLYPRPEVEVNNEPTLSERVEATEQAMADLMMMLGGVM